MSINWDDTGNRKVVRYFILCQRALVCKDAHSVGGFISMFREQYFLVCVLVLDVEVGLSKPSLCGHDVANDASERLPFFFSFFLEIFKEVSIGFKSGESLNGDLEP